MSSQSVTLTGDVKCSLLPAELLPANRHWFSSVDQKYTRVRLFVWKSKPFCSIWDT